LSLRTRIGFVLASLVAAGAGWWFLAPPLLGGRTTYVVTRGISMEPRFHTGDLVLLRTRRAYHVGEIVAYHSDDLDRTVMHRIIGYADGRYSFKGDNNNFVDPSHPPANELIGGYWFSIPKVGLGLAWASAPRHAPFLVAAAALLLLGGGARSAGRRRRSRRPPVLVPAQWLRVEGASPPPPPAPPAIETPAVEPPPKPPRRRLPAGATTTAAIAAAVLGLAALTAAGVAALAHKRPVTTRVTVPGAYRVDGSFSYHALVAPNAVYPTGRIDTGDPVFVKLVPQVTFVFAYRFSSALPHGVRGTGELKAIVASPQGWQRTLELLPPRPVQGDRGTLSATVSLADVQHVVERFQKLTGVAQSTYTLTLEPALALAGGVGGAPVKLTFSPTAAFSIDAYQLTVSQPQTLGDGPAPDPLKTSLSGGIDHVVPATMALGLATPTVRAVRRDALVAAGAAGLAALALGLLALLGGHGGRDDEDVRIEREYGEWMVPISSGVVSGASVVDVESFESLVQIAEHYERVLLRERVRGGFVYMVEEGGTVYRYSPAGASAMSRLARFPLPGEASVPVPADMSERDAMHPGSGDFVKPRASAL
jgi:signal peptidase I